ncbi:hypothetical protein BXY57_2043 [Thermoflavifilum aggregans]|uniref:Uncharacterized protein n=1 Tax=Thermoflavifilum aggregans TaxID=454188 RepID=A0A2M9CX85_9BACT|nr:hypothetical protein BXY57_2043 [Thermoflavifilum aggregans]
MQQEVFCFQSNEKCRLSVATDTASNFEAEPKAD